MSAVMGSYNNEMDASYAADFSRDREPLKKRSRHPEYRRKGSAPTRVNGMHCRRNKRWTWGSGRGARMSNLRAFASCVAVAIAAMASQVAFAQVSFNLVNINGVGNPDNPVSPGGTLGGVNYLYRMADKEVTNAQYAQFLNSVDPTGTNSLNLWNSNMQSNSGGGINRDLAASVGSRYAVKTSTPSGTLVPSGQSYASMPVNFVNWFSAARFVNWLNAGQPTNSTAMNSGVYTVNSSTSGAIVSRSITNSFANTYVLPSQDEWYKAAFFVSGSTYRSFATGSNTAPSLTTTFTIPNAGNGGNVSAIPVNVGSYTNASQSAWGMYDMFGNVGEMTDTTLTAGSTSYVWVGGGFGASTAGWSATAAVQTRLGTSADISNGFRVAQVAAVPEPETITLASFGIVGLCGANWLKRRRKAVARPAPAAELIAA